MEEPNEELAVSGVGRSVAIQLLVLRQINVLGIVPWSWRAEQDVAAGVGLPRGMAEGRWPAKLISTLLGMHRGVQQPLLSCAGHLPHVSISFRSL